MENRESKYVQILNEICQEEGITLSSYSGDWAFMLKRQDRKAFILGYQFGLNQSSVQQICTDKNIASEVLTQENVPCVFHQCYMSPQLQSYIGVQGNWRTLLGELEKHGTLVCKDNYGTGGNQVYLVHNARELEDAASKIFTVSQAMAVCPYEEIIEEFRLVILDGEIRLAFTKIRPSLTGDGVKTVAELFAEAVIDGKACGMTAPAKKDLTIIPAGGESWLLNWKHNLGQGARARELDVTELDPRAVELADRVYHALNIRFASVDVIRCADGWKVLEVNSGVMMEHFASTGPAYYQKAKSIYRDAILKMLQE
ncbi:MAG: hypothetical protein IJ468_15035 [Lachnospiraceae bacterium]|nr:hypothetical protein [Lachnospiraceae bacterium]